MSVTCHSASTATNTQLLLPSLPPTRRRWGGIFTPNGPDQFQEVTQQARPSVACSRAANDTRHNTSAVNFDTFPVLVNTKIEEVTRRPSLARSNAVCHRRSRAVSRLSEDSADSITEPIDIRWSRASSSQDFGPSTTATTPLEGSSPCLGDGHKFTLDDIRDSGFPDEVVSGKHASRHPLPRGFPGSNLFAGKDATSSLRTLSPANRGKLLQPDGDISLQAQLRKAEQRVEVLERQNQMFMHRIQKGAGGTDIGSSHNVGELIEKWIHNMQGGTKPPNTNAVATENRDELIKRVEDLETVLRKRNQTIEILMAKANMPTKSTVNNEPKHQIPNNNEVVKDYMTQSKQADEVSSCIGGSFTPRKVVLLKLIQKSSSPCTESNSYLQNSGNPSDLDTPLNTEQADKFARSLDSNSGMVKLDNISIKTCIICKMPKFLNRSMANYSTAARHSSTLSTLNEFHPAFGTTACCSKPICIACLPSAIISAITKDWWHDLGDPYWVRCPAPGCSASLPLEYNVDLTSLLGPLGEVDVLKHVRRFELAKDLRRALQGLAEQPTNEELRKAAELHEQLIKQGFMRNIFHLSKERFRLKLDVLPIDTADGRKTLRVPIFTSLLNQSWEQYERVERECIICAESIPDTVDGSPEAEERWTNITAAFPGEWTWRVRAFPPPCLLPECSTRHSLDMCRTCLSRHLETSLEAVGRAGCDTLACPLPDCEHIYTYNELKALASPETFARYDKFRLLTHLTTLPNFRWCLREGCESGQIYDPPASGVWTSPWDDIGISNRIRCDVCHFDMCFKHQVPWHGGLTCEAYDSLKTHGDPAFHATQAWISSNTKACPGPGCGVPVEKKGGCFHMTCQACKFEFCWECLADWKKILKNRAITGARRYDRRAHNVGCYFRDEGVPEPTMVVGNDIEEATRHM